MSGTSCFGRITRTVIPSYCNPFRPKCKDFFQKFLDFLRKNYDGTQDVPDAGAHKPPEPEVNGSQRPTQGPFFQQDSAKQAGGVA
jgi:hypothetical protein